MGTVLICGYGGQSYTKLLLRAGNGKYESERGCRSMEHTRYTQKSSIAKGHEVFQIALKDLECKHVIFGSPKNVYDDLVRVGYECALFGSSMHSTLLQSIKRVDLMVLNTEYRRAIGVVRTSDGKYWCANTHTALAYILRAGNEDLTCGEVPFYLVECGKPGESHIIYSHNNSLWDSREHVAKAVEKALHIEERTRKGSRKSLTYTIGDLDRLLIFYAGEREQQIYAEELNKPAMLLSELTESKQGGTL